MTGGLVIELILMRTMHAIERSLQEFDDRLWGLEEKVLGEKLEDGNIYVKRRHPDR